MSRKQLFILIGALASICLCVVCLAGIGLTYLGKNFSQAINNAGDPANVQKVASAIADYTAPEGYKQVAMDLLMYKYVMLIPDINSSASGPFIMLMSFPKNSSLSQEQMQEQMQRAFSQQSGQQVAMKVVDTQNVTIRGKDAKITILQGQLKNGGTVRQWLTIFEGKNGPVMLMIQGSTGLSWDEKLAQDFVASIK